MPKQSARALWAARIKDGTVGRSKAKAVATPTSAQRLPFTGTILGIDPSLRGTGLAILHFKAGERVRFVTSETVSPGKSAGLPECLGQIAATVKRFLEVHGPDAVAIEETIYVQNFRTAQILGAARGAAMGQAALAGLPVYEYPPLRVKQAVVGYGRASKEQVSRQMAALLGMTEALSFDEADAAAVALCHAYTLGRVQV